ncbi:hypothetical protein ACH5RR_023410 [Cinchona calisaya]|uniref:Uncharacterized protein n=1 Tax=Cinchona calisaya TaxID=153742 RepID=A0ABD2ZAN2_9GENT
MILSLILMKLERFLTFILNRPRKPKLHCSLLNLIFCTPLSQIYYCQLTGIVLSPKKYNFTYFFCVFKGIPLDFGYLFCSLWELFVIDTRRNIPFGKFLTKIFDFLNIPFSGNKQYPPYFNNSYIERKGLCFFNDQWLTKAAFDIAQSQSHASTSDFAIPHSPTPQPPPLTSNHLFHISVDFSPL